MKMIRCSYALVCLLLVINPLRAQDCGATFDGNKDNFWIQLQDHTESGCFRGDVNKWKAAKLPGAEGGKAISADIVAGWNSVKAGLEAVRDSVESLQSTLGDNFRGQTGPLDSTIARSELALDELKSISGNKPFSKREAWKVEWNRIGGGGLPPVDLDTDTGAQGEIVLQDFLERLCAAEASRGGGNTCPRSSATAHGLMYHVRLALELGAQSGAETINRIAAEVAGIDREWDQFLLQGKPMYWLDLLATDLFADYGKSGGGFRRPPKYQVFFLHPAPAMSYIEDAPDGDQLVPSVYLEIIGVNRWRSEHFSGISLIAAYSDIASTDDVGYGVLLTWNSKYSLGLLKHDDDTAISVSIDLAEAYRDKLKPQLEQIKLGR